MSLVNSHGEIVEICTPDEARTLTDRIKIAAEATWELLVKAYEVRAWAVLGYSTWDEYCGQEFGHLRLRLPREERQEVVSSLRDAGLSTRAIAAATGQSVGQTHADMSGVQNRTPEPDDDDRNETDFKGRSTWPADAVDDESDPEPEEQEPMPVKGTDGKTYPARRQGRPRRGPLGDVSQRVGWEFRKAVERLERVVEDDRFEANKEQVAAHWRGHLTYAIEVCQHILDQLDKSQED